MNVVKKCEHEWDKKRRGWGNEEEWSEEGNMKKRRTGERANKPSSEGEKEE